MDAGKINMDAYLNRIRYNGRIDTSPNTLRELHIQHTLNVPFENLDIMSGKEIFLYRDSLFKKIVVRERGGYCFEMNGLFAFILEDLGFEVKYLMGRPFKEDNTFLARTHQLLLVKAGSRDWVVDVGFGGNGLIAPVPLEAGFSEKQFTDTFRLVCHDKYGYVLQHEHENQFNNLYAFSLEEFTDYDYMAANYFCSKSPYTIFTRKKICTMPTRKGRITLTGNELKIRENGKCTRKIAVDKESYGEVLEGFFKLTLD